MSEWKIVGFKMVGASWRQGFRCPGWNIARLKNEKGLIEERYFGEEYSMMRACDTLKAEGVTGTDQFQEDFIKGNWK
jgi:hypothetical protein